VLKLAITGVGHDQPGIVAGLTGVLFQHHCNIEDSSMTILEREFTMILIVSVPDSTSVDALAQSFAEVEARLGLALFIKPLTEGGMPHHVGESFVPIMISVAGHDRTGITYRVSQVLAEFGVNITDLNAKTIVGETGPVYIMMVEAALYTSLDRPQVEAALQKLAQELEVEIKVHTLEPMTL
jgi:glycine cleavage system transcriptional repressor